MSLDRPQDSTLPGLYGEFMHAATSKEFFYNWKGFNVWLFQFIYSFHSETYDMVMQHISDIGRYSLFPYYLVAIVVYAVGAYIMRKLREKGGGKPFVAMWFGIFSVLIAGFFVNAAVIHFLKSHFEYPRPYVELHGVTLLDKNMNSGDEANISFPSGHVAFITLMVMGMWPALSKRMRFAGLVLIIAVAWARSALGAHFPADTFYAFLAATLVIIIVREIVYGIYRKIFGLNC